MLIEMRIKSMAVDPQSQMPVILLTTPDETIVVPIWIGLLEASAIATELEKVKFERPMTHDLMINVLGELNATVERVVIHALKDSTFFANLYLDVKGEKKIVDARPSDSVALAVRAGCSIWMDDSVVEQAGIRDEEGVDGEENRFKPLEDMSASDFPNKYKV